MKIAVIIPYFGKWPPWIDLYFYSCEQNSTIDWYFITDCEIPFKRFSNLYFISKSFQQYNNEVSQKLNFTFTPTNPYKLCGLRPFYAVVHADIIKDYEFWGYGDVDVIWGNIGSFYTESKFNRYDVFSTHGDRLSGHLTIVRNNNYYNTKCYKIKNWKEKLTNSDAIALDEHDFSWLLYPESRWIKMFYSKIIYKIFNWRDAWVLYNYLLPLLNLLTFSRLRRIYFKEQHTTPILSHDGLTCKHDADTWYYKDGKITNNKTSKEYIYIHFMILKKNGIRTDYYWNDNYYLLDKDYDFSKGVKISKKGFEKINP
jgi:hypothetical protein